MNLGNLMNLRKFKIGMHLCFIHCVVFLVGISSTIFFHILWTTLTDSWLLFPFNFYLFSAHFFSRKSWWILQKMLSKHPQKHHKIYLITWHLKLLKSLHKYFSTSASLKVRKYTARISRKSQKKSCFAHRTIQMCRSTQLFAKTILSNQQKVLKFWIACWAVVALVSFSAFFLLILPFSASLSPRSRLSPNSTAENL